MSTTSPSTTISPALSQRTLPDSQYEEKEGHSAEPTPASSRRPSFEGSLRTIGYTSQGQPILSIPAQQEEDASSGLALSAIRLAHRENARRKPDRSLPRDFFEKPPPRLIRFKEAEDTHLWMLQVQDQISLPPENRNLEITEKLITKYKAIVHQDPEFHRLYVQLQLSLYEKKIHILIDLRSKLTSLKGKNLQPLQATILKELPKIQQKIEGVFLGFLKAFPKDVLIWKIFVSFLKTKGVYNVKEETFSFCYRPREIVQLLRSSKLQVLQDLAWFQAISNYLEKEFDSKAKPIPDTLKQCVEVFQGKHIDKPFRWALQAEDALTRVDKVSSRAFAGVQLTPRKGKKLLCSLIQQFKQLPSDPSLPIEIHRLYLRLEMKWMQAQKNPENIEQLLSQKPEDFLAEYYIHSFLLDCKWYKKARRRIIQLLSDFPYLLWIEKLLETTEKK